MIISPFALVAISAPFLVLASAAPCLDSWVVSTNDCSYDDLENEIQAQLDSVTCEHAASIELQIALAVDSTLEVSNEIAKACGEADVPYGDISGRGDIFDKEYFDGGTYWNEERESVTEYGIVEDRLKVEPGSRIRQIHDDIAQSRGIKWPEELDNFSDCKHRAAMCCFVQDRQARDGNGNCATPYDENCHDADPADNTDVCYVDMARAPTSSRTTEGFAVFERNAEDDSHCHGLAWGNDPTDASGRFKGNSLFYVSMYDHFIQRGYVRNVPGAPMCGCIEQMPVVTRSDCTQIDVVSEDVEFSFTKEDGLKASISNLEIDFNACQGANNNNNDLAAYYQRLVNENKATQEEKDEFDQHIVGEYYCREAIDSFLDSQDLIRRPACRDFDPVTCGCEEVREQDYRGDISVTNMGLECQRWDEQEPHRHGNTRRNRPDSGLSENYCRNPDNEPGGAWCYTTNSTFRWQYCDVPVCGAPDPTPRPTEAPTTPGPTGSPTTFSPTLTPVPACEASDPDLCGCEKVLQKDYRGTINVTLNGLECLRWDVHDPHPHYRNTRVTRPNAGLIENYCRNPDNEPNGAWCYTTDRSVRWEYCNVPVCGATPDPDVTNSTRALRG